MRLRVRQFTRNTRGAVLAEAAIALPVIILLLSATAEFGRYMYTYNTLAKATRVSARHISNKPLNSCNIAQTKNLAVYGNTAGTGSPILPGLTTSQITVTPTSGTPTTVTVSVTGYNYTTLFTMYPVNSLNNIAVSPSTQIRYLMTATVMGGC